jgi:hypothetical protein
MNTLGRPWPALVGVSTAAVLLAVGLGLPTAVRGPLAIWFCLTCPGFGVLGLLDVEDLLAEVLLAVGVSIALGVLVTVAMVLTHTWSPAAGTAILAVVSLAGAAVQLRRRRLRGETPPHLRLTGGVNQ